jgi:uncharacterized protein GlcG (DUF336 family)
MSPATIQQEEEAMYRLGIGIAAAALTLASAPSVKAQAIITHHDLSAATALTMAETALDTCTKNGYRVSVSVVDREGETIVQVHGDNANPHTFENSRRKAYTARTFGIPSAEFAERYKSDPARWQQVTLPSIIAAAGALPIKVGDEVIGAIGVSGSPGGDKDEACAKAAIDKVADQLK